MVKGKKILVAGGTGLIGSNLTKRLVSLGAHVKATCFSNQPPFLNDLFERRDLTKVEECLAVTRGIKYAFLCAAPSFGAKRMKEEPTTMVLPSLRIDSGLLEACRLNQVEKVVFISSSTVYQESLHPLREDDLDWNKPTCELYQGVGWMKRYLEKLCQFYYQVYKMPVAIVRPTSIYGPQDHFSDDKSHVLPALIKRALKKKDPYVVWGDGSAVRDFIYVDDFVSDLVDILDCYCIGEPINVGTGVSMNIREAVKKILQVCGHSVEPQYDKTKPSAVSYRMLDTTKFRSVFGEKKRTTFEEGISKTATWYQSIL